MVIWRPSSLPSAISLICDTVTWPLDEFLPRERLEMLDRALDDFAPPTDLTPRQQTAWLAASMCEQLLALPWLPEAPRVAEALLHDTCERSGIRLRDDFSRLSMVVNLRAWARTSRRDFGALVDLMEEALDCPELPDPDEVDWSRLLRTFGRHQEPWGIVSGSPYEQPTYYIGDLAEIPEIGAEKTATERRIVKTIAAVIAHHPQPFAVGVVRGFAPTRGSKRPYLPARPDAYIVTNIPVERETVALDALQRKDGPKLLLRDVSSDRRIHGIQGTPHTVDALGPADSDNPAALARWFYATFEMAIATFRRRMSHWVLELPRVHLFTERLDVASDAAILRAEHRSGISIGQMQRIVSGDAAFLGDLPTRQVARLFDSLCAPCASDALNATAGQRVNIAALRRAAREEGWDEPMVTYLQETARQLIAAGSDYRLMLDTEQHWIDFHARLLGDR
jgi:hypothetical protein